MTSPAEHAARATENATDYEDAFGPDAAVAPAPELAGVEPETTPNVDGVNVEAMPALKTFTHALPSERAKLQASMMKVVKALPKQWVTDGSSLDETDLASQLADLDPDNFVTMFEQMEQLVFDAAEDFVDMRTWIIEQESPTDALTYAFGQVSNILGN